MNQITSELEWSEQLKYIEQALANEGFLESDMKAGILIKKISDNKKICVNLTGESGSKFEIYYIDTKDGKPVRSDIDEDNTFDRIRKIVLDAMDGTILDNPEIIYTNTVNTNSTIEYDVEREEQLNSFEGLHSSIKEIQKQTNTLIDTDLNLENIKQYICPTATDQEAFMFLKLCEHRQLNPFTKEAYLVKYGNNAASMIVGKDAFLKRAEAQKQFDGFEAGIIVLKSDGSEEIKTGTFVSESDKLVGGWAKVYRKDHTYPVEISVSMNEYNTRKSSWEKIPATMIRKVALVQALRESFPSELSGMYDSAEIED